MSMLSNVLIYPFKPYSLNPFSLQFLKFGMNNWFDIIEHGKLELSFTGLPSWEREELQFTVSKWYLASSNDNRILQSPAIKKNEKIFLTNKDIHIYIWKYVLSHKCGIFGHYYIILLNILQSWMVCHYSSSCLTSHLADSKQWKTIMDNGHDRAAADTLDQLNQK